MEDDKVLHNILLKKAKEAEYSSFEIEQINLQTETLFIRYFLEREAAKVVEGTKIEDEVLKKIYDENKEFYTFPEKVKLDTIFVREQDKAEKLLKEVTVENFNELKEKNDEKTDAAQKNVDDNFIFINDIHPAIAEEIYNEDKKDVILSNLVPVQEGFHIVYLKDKEDKKQATFEEAKETILNDVKRNLFGQAYNQLIADIANEKVTLETDETKEENQEK
ncbi:peptidylprolyl isomerase [Fusobacterium pseudoperiodonticum]|jgi:peptidyl-prolyl cis-trans isomerase (fragment)|uniref:peptidylprolyl isomerase n=1 Tax=Fusobacterium pseudoperiodonticum TaxID=2663009 RepID=A0A2G9EAU7_9FUSO|nr:peptidylprolyl isomerase [Fusobacterium pseudoperiodonticum]ATV58143.1 peptidylprolyl isomerase [Fusobacterium pseudoperiodonticum]ATV63799.1 peptidylprolyl isomerase [Fusobacterium pseudoperiodonticum]ATV65832.1 peptidylprolyl isomerase [Fusobacterium pseudoperiodonticum]ATV67245.1 peptidylprolyl isomerase [Fusobacterium pseudoperiodonticum]ATV71593.1 peptidylprolyl isomerase [Fusobacterium pseudoperiodonticum]